MDISKLAKAIKSGNITGTLLAILAWMAFFTYVGTIEYHSLKTTADYAKTKAIANELAIAALKEDINSKFDQLRRDIRAGENRLSDKIDNLR